MAPTPPTDDGELVTLTYPCDFEDGTHGNEIVNIETDWFRLIIAPGCKNIPDGRFEDYKGMVELVFPEGEDSSLVRIGRQAF